MAANPVYTNSMSSANSLVTFDLGGTWQRIFIQVPTFTSTTALDLYGAVASNATYYQIFKDPSAPASTAVVSYSISASVGANGALIPMTLGFRYFRIKATDSAPTAAVDFKVICGGNY